ncbi:restriction endonuclease [Mesorhizobium sp. LNHC209A00]|uniref:restriction endonuclease n=1 Tax=Mesorhizobium TaxID=68287 RepID=UPI0009FD75B2|nr:restriction endonuclease [Mesorhizobium sp. LNHC209A00]
MPLITARIPDNWEELEDLIQAILAECGMKATRQVTIKLPRGSVDVDVLAEETVDGITSITVCECKNWKARIPKEIVHACRTVMQETGANNGYIISREGFQSGAIEAVAATNINLVTFEQFQERFFEKWYRNRLWAIEDSLHGFHTYYEMLGKPGYNRLTTDEERAAYDVVWDRHLFAGLMLMSFSPYSGLLKGGFRAPPLPFDVSKIVEMGADVPEAAQNVQGYRELLSVLEAAGKEGLAELRKVNPITRDKETAQVAEKPLRFGE